MDDFFAILRIVERKCDDFGVPRIDIDDGIALYSLLYVLATEKNNVVVIDAGAGVGYSTLWLLKALEDACAEGVLYAIERDKTRFLELEKTLGMLKASCVKVYSINDDAIEFVERKFDFETLNFIFIDIDKNKYFDMFIAAKNKLAKGGLMAFHNAYMVKNVVEKILNEAHKINWFATIIPTDEGILLLRKR